MHEILFGKYHGGTRSVGHFKRIKILELPQCENQLVGKAVVDSDFKEAELGRLLENLIETSILFLVVLQGGMLVETHI